MGSFGKVIAVQDAISEIQGRVEIYSFGEGFIQLPTVIERPGYLIHQILGNREAKKALLVSPTFGTAMNAYYKSVKNLRVPIKSGGYIPQDGKPAYWSTEEDTIRFWATRNPEFIEELEKDGWIYFEKFKELTEEQAEKFGVNAHRRHIAKVSLPSLIRIMHGPDSSYQFQARDLTEIVGSIGKDVNETFFVYEAGGGESNSNFFTTLSHAEGELVLKLDELGRWRPDREGEQANTLMRTILFSVPFSQKHFSPKPDWWSEKTSLRVNELVSEYREARNIEGYVDITNDGGGLKTELSNRNHYAPESNPDTKRLIQQAVDLRRFAVSAIAEEHKNYNSSQDTIKQERKRALGLLVQQ